MIELELKARVPDPTALAARLRDAGAHEEFSGEMSDSRLDFANGSLAARDEVLRVRVYRSTAGLKTASLDWKGPATVDRGYKRREEIGSSVDPDTITPILTALGLGVVHRIDRTIRQFTLDGVTIRMEHYPEMDDLVEVEGAPEAIEATIDALDIPRAEFTAESLTAFAQRFTARTGRPAVLGRNP
jgi:adenylate cyclase class IV